MRPLYCGEGIYIPAADGIRRVAGRSTLLGTRSDWAVPTENVSRMQLINDWILVTFDDDSLSLVEGSGLEYVGIIYV